MSLQKREWPAICAKMAHKMNTKKCPLSQDSQPRESSYKKTRPEGTLWRLDERPLWTQIGLFVYTDACIHTHTNTNVCVHGFPRIHFPSCQLRDNGDTSGAMTTLSAQFLVSSATLHQRNWGYLQRG